MSDIDFDELDKAVNTLMSDVPKAELVKTEDDIKTLTISPTLSDVSNPSLTKLDSTLTEVNGPVVKPVEKPAVVTPTRPPTPSLAARRGGRFMDVVHPSSDMKSATKAIVPMSRQGVTIEPTGKIDDIIAPESYKDLTVSDVAVQPQAAADDSAQHETPTNDWPDPLEMSGYNAEPDTKSADVKTEETTVIESTEVVQSADSVLPMESVDTLDYEDTQSLTSPFIADAKVTKRPLGGAPVEEEPVEEPGHAPVLGALTADDEMVSTTESPADQLPENPAVRETQLPPELQSDLMAIEADGDTATAVTEEAVVSTVTEPKPEPEVDSASIVTTKAESTSSAVVSAGPTSIPQQYHEEPSTSDESNGSIYDTDSYHQPLAHPAKTKSGWLWIIWILLLLIVGGGGAVALYFII